MSRWKIIALIIAALIIAGLAYNMLGGSGNKPGFHAPGAMGNDGPVPVTVVPVEQRNVPVYLFSQGTVQARKAASIQPRVGGLLLSIDFAEGQHVEEGQILATIDPSSYQAQYDQALARKKQNLALLATARSNLERSRELFRKSYISKQELTELENTVSQYEAAVAADAAAARDAELNLEYTKVRAPFSGMTGLRQVDPGNTVDTNNSIVVITQIHPVNLLFSLPAENLDEVRRAQAEASLSVAALGSADRRVLNDQGKLIVIDNRIDSASSTFRLKAEFPNEDDALWPGQFVNVRLRVGEVIDGLVIPTQAVQRGPDGEFVYLLQDDQTVTMQPIYTTEGADALHTLVRSGLQAGDQVVTEGAFRLKPGSKVTPLAPGEILPASRPGSPAGTTSSASPASPASAPA